MTSQQTRYALVGVLVLMMQGAWAQGTAPTAPLAATAPTSAAPASAPEAPAAAAAGAPASSAPTTAAAPPAASSTEPSVILNSQINSGDTAWMLASMALVLMMTIPGLALFYGGMVRKKNVLATLMQSFAITCLVTILWYVAGYSLAFTPGTPYIGGLSRLLMNGVIYIKDVAAAAATKDTPAVEAVVGKVSVSHLGVTIPETVYAMFQLTFAIITPALICGAFAERMKFSAMLWFMAVWSLIVYAPIAHWMWEPGGWGATAGVLDFAGGTVVHINAGIAALACVFALGRRVGYHKEPMAPHNLVLTVIGASLLWVGWFGFNAGSAVAADGRAGMAMAVTQIATAAAALAWMFMEWIVKGKPSVLGIASGAVAGLVAITPASGFVMPTPSMIVGIAAGIICFLASTSLKKALGYDDSLDAFGVHCIGGIVGALLTGVFASTALDGGQAGSVVTQLKAVLATLAYGFVVSYLILKVIDFTIGLRVSEEEEREGLDVSQHGEHVE